MVDCEFWLEIQVRIVKRELRKSHIVRRARLIREIGVFFAFLQGFRTSQQLKPGSVTSQGWVQVEEQKQGSKERNPSLMPLQQLDEQEDRWFHKNNDKDADDGDYPSTDTE